MTPDGRESLEQARERLRDSRNLLSSTVSRAQQEVDRAAAAHQRETARDRVDERFEEATRSGRAGRDMRRIQERVDRGEFTWDEVLTGHVADERMQNAVWRFLGRLKSGIDREGIGAAESRSDEGPSDDDVFGDPLGHSR